jgi:hypothetical protein
MVTVRLTGFVLGLAALPFVDSGSGKLEMATAHGRSSKCGSSMEHSLAETHRYIQRVAKIK